MTTPSQTHLSRRAFLSGAAASALAATRARGAVAASAPASRPADFFDRPALLSIHLALSPEAQDALRKNPRAPVEGTVTMDGTSLPRVGVQLKGTTSFMPIDQKPSWTLSFARNRPGRRFAGHKKIHLNNSVQDSSYLCDDLCSELFRRAGVPAARTAWAVVRLNDRRLGLYVIKESLNEDFLARHFASTRGNFYDGGLHHEINQQLILDSGEGPRDRSDLKALYDAAVSADLPARWHKLQPLLDVERFISMMAMESLTAHIDGYSLMQNNYRIYFEPPHRRAVFIAHGLDRMFEQPQLPVEPPMRAALSRGILETPEGRRRLLSRLRDLAQGVFTRAWIDPRLDANLRLLEPAEPLIAPTARALRQRIHTRIAFVAKHLAALPAAPR